MSELERLPVAGAVLAGRHRWSDSLFERVFPSALVPIADSPLMCYALRWLSDGGVKRGLICANSDSRLVRRCLRDGADYGLDLYYYEDRLPRGPAGSLRDAIGRWPASELVIVEGSVLPTLELERLLYTHRRRKADVTVVVDAGTNGTASDKGMLRPAGIFVIGEDALREVPETGYQDLKESMIPKLHKAGGRVFPYRINAPLPRVTGLDSYLRVNEYVLLRAIEGGMSLPGYERSGQAYIHDTAEVASDVKLIGPVMVGPQTRIASGVTVVGPATIGQGCVLEEDSVACRSVMWDRSRLAWRAIVDHCVMTFDTAVAREMHWQDAVLCNEEMEVAQAPVNRGGARAA